MGEGVGTVYTHKSVVGYDMEVCKRTNVASRAFDVAVFVNC